MLLRYLIKNPEKRKQFAHVGAGIVILVHAYEKYEYGHGSYISFIIAGLVFLSIAFFHPVIEKKAPWVDGVFLIIEGILSVIVAFEYFHVGKKALPVTFLLLAIFQFFMAFRKSKKGIQYHQLHHKQ